MQFRGLPELEASKAPRHQARYLQNATGSHRERGAKD